jgi:hypothetical protein
MNFKIKAKALKFYLEACLDVDPFQKLQVPSGQAVFKDLPPLQIKGQELIRAFEEKSFEFEIKMSRVRIPPRILELKIFMEQFLKGTNGVMDAAERDKNEMTISVLKTVKFMLSHGFYKT